MNLDQVRNNGSRQNTEMTVRNRFKIYEPEERSAVRIPQVAKNERIEELKKQFKRFEIPKEDNFLYGAPDFPKPNWYYDGIVEHGDLEGYSAEDVEAFSIALVELQDEKDFATKAGMFLSALINLGTDKTYVIHTQHFEILPEYLGYKNTKTIIVKGNVGHLVGNCMTAGKILVEGDAGKSAGSNLYGGEIEITGNVDNGLADEMNGGRIIVHGNVEHGIACHANGGEIHLLGEWKHIFEYWYAETVKIFHK